MSEGCGKKLAKGQWWGHCGETDMGQTLPALCTHCGGVYILQEDEDMGKEVGINFDYPNRKITAPITASMEDIYKAMSQNRREDEESRKYEPPIRPTIVGMFAHFILSKDWIILYRKEE